MGRRTKGPKQTIGKRRTDRLEQACIQEIERVVKFFREANGKEIPFPRTTFNKKGAVAGICHNGPEGIDLNKELLKTEREKFINHTPGHEAVHWCEYKLFGNSNHGKRWKSMMSLVGLEPKRYHSYDTSKVIAKFPKKHKYHCQCRTIMLTSIRHNRIQRNQRTYWCGSCKGILKEGEFK